MCNCSSCCSRGPQGPIGYGWSFGSGVPVNPPVENRIYYVNGDNNDVYEWDGAAWNLVGNLGTGGGTESFTVVYPTATDGVVNPNHSLVNGSAALGTSDDILCWVDRNNCHEDVVISLANVPDPSFQIQGTGGSPAATLTIPTAESSVNLNNTMQLVWTGGVIPAGTYTLDLVFTTVSCGTRTVNVELVLS